MANDEFFATTTRQWDNLFVSRSVEPLPVERTLLSGENLARGAMLGQVERKLGTVEADSGNTGDGTITNGAMKKKSKIGTYKITMLGASAFRVQDSDGNELENGAAGTTYDNEFLTFDITAGGTPFIAGDFFTFAVDAETKDADGNYKLKLADDNAVDGSRVPRYVLAEAKDASAADKLIAVYQKGVYNQEKVTYGSNFTLAEVKTVLAEENLDIHLREVVKA